MSLEINGMKSQTNTVTMEAECWQEPKPEVYSGGTDALTHSHTYEGTETDLWRHFRTHQEVEPQYRFRQRCPLLFFTCLEMYAVCSDSDFNSTLM